MKAETLEQPSPVCSRRSRSCVRLPLQHSWPLYALRGIEQTSFLEMGPAQVSSTLTCDKASSLGPMSVSLSLSVYARVTLSQP